jgi:hypothetical protein
MQWLSMGHLWWAGLGVYVLVRTLGFSRPAALLAGTAFQFSDPLFIHLGNYNLIAVLSWMGWVLAALHRTLHSQGMSRRLAWASLTALLFALSTYPGHAQSSYYVGMAVGGYWMAGTILRWASHDQRMKNKDWVQRTSFFILHSLGPMALIALLTFLLAAPILLPAVGMIPWTARASFAYQETVGFSLAPVPGVVGLLTPGFFGRGPALHWGLWDRVELPYAGVVTLLLAVAALTLTRRRVDWARLLPWIGLGLFGFGVALGIYAPLHGWLTQILPGYAQFRAPARAVVLFTLSLCVLAAAGVDGVLARSKQQGSDSHLAFLRWGGLALGTLWLPGVLAALLFWQEEPMAFMRASVAGLAVSWAVAAWLGTWLLISLWSRGALGRGWFAGLVTGLLLIELAATGAYTDIAEADPAANFHHPEIVQFLSTAQGPQSPVAPALSSFRMDTRTGIEPFWQPNTAALHWGQAGLEDVWGVANPLVLSHYDRFSESTGGRHTRLYDMLNAAYVIVADETPLPEKFTLAYDAPGPLAVYHNPQALPRAWLVTEALHLPDEEAALAALMAPEFDPLGVVLLSPTPQPDPLWPLFLPASPTTSLRMTLPSPGHLVLSEVWYPGWRARVNGADVPVLRANYAFRAIPVPAGEVTVNLYFVPTSWQWGVLCFGLGMALILGLAGAGWLRHRSAARAVS